MPIISTGRGWCIPVNSAIYTHTKPHMHVHFVAARIIGIVLKICGYKWVVLGSSGLFRVVQGGSGWCVFKWVVRVAS